MAWLATMSLRRPRKSALAPELNWPSRSISFSILHMPQTLLGICSRPGLANIESSLNDVLYAGMGRLWSCSAMLIALPRSMGAFVSCFSNKATPDFF